MAPNLAEPVPSSQFDIVLPVTLNAGTERVTHLADDPSRNTEHQRPRRYFQSLSQYGTGSYHGPPADPDAIQEDRSHSDEALIFDDAAMENGPMANADATANGARHPVVHMDHTEILDVGFVADLDWGHIPSNHRVVPNAGVAAKAHVAHDHRTWRDEGSGMNHGL
jgi:hypothetical protein